MKKKSWHVKDKLRKKSLLESHAEPIQNSNKGYKCFLGAFLGFTENKKDILGMQEKIMLVSCLLKTILRLPPILPPIEILKNNPDNLLIV